jgi:hypothetical protein
VDLSTEENFKWRWFVSWIIDFGSLKLNVKWGKSKIEEHLKEIPLYIFPIFFFLFPFWLLIFVCSILVYRELLKARLYEAKVTAGWVSEYPFG